MPVQTAHWQESNTREKWGAASVRYVQKEVITKFSNELSKSSNESVDSNTGNSTAVKWLAHTIGDLEISQVMFASPLKPIQVEGVLLF